MLLDYLSVRHWALNTSGGLDLSRCAGRCRVGRIHMVYWHLFSTRAQYVVRFYGLFVNWEPACDVKKGRGAATGCRIATRRYGRPDLWGQLGVGGFRGRGAAGVVSGGGSRGGGRGRDLGRGSECRGVGRPFGRGRSFGDRRGGAGATVHRRLCSVKTCPTGAAPVRLHIEYWD